MVVLRTAGWSAHTGTRNPRLVLEGSDWCWPGSCGAALQCAIGEAPKKRRRSHEPGPPSQNRTTAFAYSCPCSVFSWQVMQYRVHGTASSLFCCSSSWHELHSPYVPSLIRNSALSTSANSERSLCVWPNRNSLV